ncbi:MAG TPA: hypothetical protein VIX14_11920 [Terriglobales bacterium]
MKNAVLRAVLTAAMATRAFRQTTECAKATKNGDEGTRVGDSIRLVDSIANTLAQRFGILVSAEEPQYQFAGDWQDVREADPD